MCEWLTCVLRYPSAIRATTLHAARAARATSGDPSRRHAAAAVHVCCTTLSPTSVSTAWVRKVRYVLRTSADPSTCSQIAHKTVAALFTCSLVWPRLRARKQAGGPQLVCAPARRVAPACGCGLGGLAEQAWSVLGWCRLSWRLWAAGLNVGAYDLRPAREDALRRWFCWRSAYL